MNFPSIADIAAVKPNGAYTFLANGNATFINGPANLLNNLPKNPPDCIIFFICASCGVSFLLKFLIPNLNVAPLLDLTAFF